MTTATAWFRDSSWLDDRERPNRRLRVAAHTERRMVVLSLWDDDVCTGTFRLAIDDAPVLIASLVNALHGATFVKREAHRSLLVEAIDRARAWLRRSPEDGAVILPWRRGPRPR